MKTNLLFLILGLLAFSCSSVENYAGSGSSQVELQAEGKVDIAKSLAPKDYVDRNLFIDVDVEAFDKIVRDNFDRNNPESAFFAMKNYPEEWAMVRAALYRFESSLDVVDGYYSCTSTAKDLNMSERTFNSFKKNIDRTNADAKILREKGTEVPIMKPTKARLESILNEAAVK